MVLAAGAIMSPHLLIHSGIGPRSELERVGVKCVIDLPGVGRSLRDHAITGMVGLLPDDADEATHGFQVMLRCGPAGTESDLFILGAIVKTSSLNFPTPVVPTWLSRWPTCSAGQSPPGGSRRARRTRSTFPSST